MHDALGVDAVDTDPGVDPRASIAEEVLHAPEVSQAFLAHASDEQQIGLGVQLGSVHRL